MKKTTKYLLGGGAIVGAWLLWSERAAAGAAATAAYERATGTAPPAQPPVAGLDLGAPPRGHHRPGRGGSGGGSTVVYGGPWGYPDDDPYEDALRLALALEQGRRMHR